MDSLHIGRILCAAAALAAGVAGAQSVSRTTTTNGPAAQASAGTAIGGAGTISGTVAAGGALPEGTGSSGRAIIVITQPPSGTNAMGAGAAPPRGALTAVDIAAMFMGADTNRDGDLSRAEAGRLQLPMSFDELDTNHDGVISRFEFDEAFR
jgi:hypothetical protein